MMHGVRGFARVRLVVGIAVATALIQSCTADRDTSEAASTATDQPQATTGDVVARADFVLCPAIEGIADQLAAIAGFERDPERRVQGMSGECFVRGKDLGWIIVSRPPAVIRSVAMQAGGYDAEPTPLPELGDRAVFIGDRLQPHVIFELLGQIIDVGMESSQGTPDQATMIEAAILVREALVTANRG